MFHIACSLLPTCSSLLANHFLCRKYNIYYSCPSVSDGKTLMLGKIKGRRREGQSMRWLDDIRLDGHEFEQTLGVGDGQGSLACGSPRGHEEKRLSDWIELIWWKVVPGSSIWICTKSVPKSETTQALYPTKWWGDSWPFVSADTGSTDVESWRQLLLMVAKSQVHWKSLQNLSSFYTIRRSHYRLKHF